MLGGEANRPSNPQSWFTQTHVAHTRHGVFPWAVLDWYAEKERGVQKKDLAYKWCPLFDPLGEEGGVQSAVEGGSDGEGCPTETVRKGWETNISMGFLRAHCRRRSHLSCFCWWVQGRTTRKVRTVLLLESAGNLPMWDFSSEGL